MSSLLGRKQNQINFSNLETWCNKPLVPEDSFYGLLARFGDRLVEDDDFAELYAGIGRPSNSPALLAKVLLLMYHDDVSDREAEQRARYDLRWKHALNLGLDETGFDHTALCRFRSGLLIHDKQRLVFERFIALAQEAKILKTTGATHIIDSTYVLGAGAVQDTYNLIKSAVRRVLRVTRRNPKLNARLKGVLDPEINYEKPGKPKINWDDPQEKKQLLTKLVRDAQSVQEILTAAGEELSQAETQATELLRAVTLQDVKENEDGTYEIKKGTAHDRIVSTTDPEMRHVHKSARTFEGHKVQVVADRDTGIITNVAVTAGNAHDSAALPTAVTEQSIKPAVVMGDTAYGATNVRKDMTAEKIELIAPAPPAPKRENRFSKEDFNVDLETMTCTCPAGHTTKKYRSKQRLFLFDKRICNTCPLRDQCTKHGQGRTVRLHEEEAILQEARRQQKTDSFKQVYRFRSLVERDIAEMVFHGARQARYIGRVKTQLQMLFTAVVVNLKALRRFFYRNDGERNDDCCKGVSVSLGLI